MAITSGREPANRMVAPPVPTMLYRNEGKGHGTVHDNGTSKVALPASLTTKAFGRLRRMYGDSPGGCPPKPVGQSPLPQLALNEPAAASAEASAEPTATPVTVVVATQAITAAPPSAAPAAASSTGNAATPEAVLLAPVVESEIQASSARFCSALPVAQQAAVERAKSVHSEAGGPTDPYLDVTMARFCMENDWNDEKTHAQIRKAVAFRTSNNAAEYRKALLGGRRLVEFERWQQAGTVLPALPYIGTTWHGDPMQLSGPGGIDVERLLATISLDDFFDFNLLVLEFNSLNIDKLTLARADGTLVRMVMIINAAGVTFAHLKLMKYTRLVAPLADAYYPEFIASATSFNVNPVIYVGYNMLRPLLSGLRLMIELGTLTLLC
jgi:hypothetical protein